MSVFFIGELIDVLMTVYQSNGQSVDLTRLYECPGIIQDLGAGTANQKKKTELIFKLYSETQTFLNSLPGPSIVDT